MTGAVRRRETCRRGSRPFPWRARPMRATGDGGLRSGEPSLSRWLAQAEARLLGLDRRSLRVRRRRSVRPEKPVARWTEHCRPCAAALTATAATAHAGFGRRPARVPARPPHPFWPAYPPSRAVRRRATTTRTFPARGSSLEAEGSHRRWARAYSKRTGDRWGRSRFGGQPPQRAHASRRRDSCSFYSLASRIIFRLLSDFSAFVSSSRCTSGPPIIRNSAPGTS